MAEEQRPLIEFVGKMDLTAAMKSLGVLKAEIDKSVASFNRSAGVGSSVGLIDPKSIGQLKSNIGQIRTQLDSVNTAGIVTGDVFQKVGNKTVLAFNDMGSSIRKNLKFDLINSQIDQFSSHVISMGKNMQWLGRQMTIGLTLPIIAFGVKAVQSFNAINESYTRLETVMGGKAFTQMASDAGMANDRINIVDGAVIRVGNDVKKISGQTFTFSGTKTVGENFEDLGKKIAETYGISQKVTAGILADWAQMGYRSKDLAQIAVAVAKTATLGQLDTSSASDFFKSTMAIFATGQAGIKDTGQAIQFTYQQMEKFQQIADATSLSMTDLNEAFPKVAESAAIFGLNASQLSSVLAGMNQQGIDAGTSANALKFIINRLIAPSKTAAKAVKELTGVDLNSGAFKNLSGIQKFLDLADKITKLNPADQGKAAAAIGGTRQINALLALFRTVQQGTAELASGSKANMNDYAKGIAAANDSASSTTKAAAAKIQQFLQSPSHQLKILETDFQDAMGKFGKALEAEAIPAFRKLVDLMAKIADMPPWADKLVIGVAVLLAAMGPVVLITGLLTSVFGTVTKAGSKVAELLHKLIKPALKEVDDSILVSNATLKEFQGTLVSAIGKFYQVGDAAKTSFDEAAGAVEESAAIQTKAVNTVKDAVIEANTEEIASNDALIASLDAVTSKRSGMELVTSASILAESTPSAYAETLSMVPQIQGTTPTPKTLGSNWSKSMQEAKNAKATAAAEAAAEAERAANRSYPVPNIPMGRNAVGQFKALEGDFSPLGGIGLGSNVTKDTVKEIEQAGPSITEKLKKAFYLPASFDFGVSKGLNNAKSKLSKTGETAKKVATAFLPTKTFGKISSAATGDTAKAISSPLKNGIEDAISAFNPSSIGKKFEEGVNKSIDKSGGVIRQTFRGMGSVAKQLAGGPLSVVEGGFGSIGKAITALLPEVAGLMGSFALFTGVGAIIAVVVMAIIGIKKHWTEIRAAMEPGIKAIGVAFGTIETAVKKVIGVFMKAVSGPLGGAGVGQSASVWKTLGGIISQAMEGVAKAMDLVAWLIGKAAPLIKDFGTTIGDEIGFISALFHGDWAKLWPYAYHIVYDLFLRPLATLFDDVVKIVAIALEKVIGGISTFAKKIPLIGKAIKGGLDDAESSIKKWGDSLNLENYLGGLFKVPQSTGTEAAASFSMGFKKAIPPGTPKIQPKVDPAALSDASDTLTKFLSALQNELDQSVNKVKTAATNAFNDVIEAKTKAFNQGQTNESDLFDVASQQILKGYDDRITAIQKLSAADQKRYDQEQYLAQRRQMLLDQQVNSQNYETARALAVYEGRTDDARMLDLQHQSDTTSSQQQLKDLDSQHNQSLLDAQRQAQIDQITAAKAAEQLKIDVAKKSFDIQQQNASDAFSKQMDILKQSFSDQLDEITKHTPENVAQYKTELDQINGLMVKFGASPAFPNAGQTAMQAFGNAVKEAQKDVVDDAFWAGNAAGLAMAKGYSAGLAAGGVGGAPGSAGGAGSSGKTPSAGSPQSGTPGYFNASGGNAAIDGAKQFVEQWLALVDKEQGSSGLTPQGQKIMDALNKIGGVGRTGITDPVDMANAILLYQLAKVTTKNGVSSIDSSATGSMIMSKMVLDTSSGGDGTPKYKHSGGPIGNTRQDEDHYILQHGEYVINKKAASKVGHNALAMINSMAAPNPQVPSGFLADKDTIQQPMQDWFSKLPENAYKWMNDKFPEYSEKIKSLWKTHWDDTRKDSDNAWDTLNRSSQGKLTTSNDNVRFGLGNIKTTSDSIWNSITLSTSGIWNQISGAVNSGVNTVSGDVGTASAKWGGSFNSIKSAFGTPVNFVLTTVMSGLETQLNTFTTGLGLGNVFSDKFVTVPVKHAGGVVGNENVTRNINPGTGAGIAPNEQLTLMQKGETVLPLGVSIASIIAKAVGYKTSANMHKVVAGTAYSEGTKALSWGSSLVNFLSSFAPAASGGAGSSSFTPGKQIPASKGVSDYINLILPYVIQQARRTGIQPSVMLAQSGNETGWGTSKAWRDQLNPAGLDITGSGVKGSSFSSIAQAFTTYANRLMGIGEGGQGPFVQLVKAHASSISEIKALEAGPWAGGKYGGALINGVRQPGHGLESLWYSYGLGKYDIPGLANGGIIKARPGGQLFRGAEAGVDEAVLPLTKTNIQKAFKFAMPNIAKDSVGQVVSAGTNVHSVTEEHYHFDIDTFIGEDQWFADMQKKFQAQKGRVTQRAQGQVNRTVGSYKDNTVRYNR